MPWEIAHADDIGGRDQQQDRVKILSQPASDTHLLIVADGMGGHSDGALAAQAVIDAAEHAFQTARIADAQSFLMELCLASHQAIKNLEAQDQPSPGSTCVMLLLRGEEAYWLHVGDSRLYLMQQGQVVSQTRDHSVVQLMVAEGKMTEQEAAVSDLQNQIYNRLGGDKDPEPDLDATVVEDGDVFILSSDGLWGSVGPDEVMQGLATASSLETVVHDLVYEARIRGGDTGDNICLILARRRPDAPRSKSGFLRRLFSG